MGVTYAEREDAGKAIIHVCTHMNGAGTVPVGSYRGFDMALSYDSKTNEFHMTLKGSLSHTAVLGADAGGNVTRIDNALEKINERLENARSQLAHATEQLENARTEMTAPFPREAELAEKTRRLNELNVLLNLNEPDRVVCRRSRTRAAAPGRERQTGNGDLHPSAFTGRGREQGSRLFRPAALLSPTLQKVAYFRKFSLCGCGRCFKIAGCSDTQPARKPL